MEIPTQLFRPSVVQNRWDVNLTVLHIEEYQMKIQYPCLTKHVLHVFLKNIIIYHAKSEAYWKSVIH